jgi:hypothetical protein
MELPFPKKEWTYKEKQQFRNISKIEIIKLLDKDKRWDFKGVKGNKYVYYNSQIKPPYDYLTIHYHKEGYRDIKLLLYLLDQWCCNRDDLKRWKVIKG